MIEKALFIMAAIAAIGEFILDAWKEWSSRSNDKGKKRGR